jgi:glycosyltransferase involved in cell wall biosynthesis
MKISIVIPVYNEADSLSACLDSIAVQQIKPYEVIVVDNNSTDDTACIAKAYSFVTLIKEKRQGVVHARTTGFNKAKGEIIARIDGDSILPNDWTLNIEKVFQDKTIDAASGLALYYAVSLAWVFNAIDLFFRRRLSKQMANELFLWGANMAIRRQSWEQTKQYLCQKGDMHEDYDLAIHLQEQGGKVVFDERMKAYVSSRRIDVNFISFMHYVMVNPRTYKIHGINALKYMYPVILVCAVGYVPGFILHRGYDETNDHFSFIKLLTTSREIARVDPTTNVA